MAKPLGGVSLIKYARKLSIIAVKSSRILGATEKPKGFEGVSRGAQFRFRKVYNQEINNFKHMKSYYFLLIVFLNFYTQIFDIFINSIKYLEVIK